MAGVLGDLLRENTKEGVLYEKHPDGSLTCFACGHRCLIKEGRSGICKVRFNDAGVLKVPSGYVGALQVDPIEKKPFFHAFPGTLALSFGMLGCDFHCGYCQNWVTSQALRDPNSTTDSMPISPAQLCDLGQRSRARVLASTYNEPLITSEWAVEIFKLSKQRGFVNAYISNGNGTDEVLDYIRPHVDLYKVDLKSFREKNYRELGGRLDVVLRTIEGLKKRGFWLEVVTLVIPGFNDSDEELRDTAQFLAGVSRDIPWHVTAFHKDYKMQDPDNTTPSHLERACEIGAKVGLRYIYAGNLPGRVDRWENTVCPSCGKVLIERHGYQILADQLSGRGTCPGCNTAIPGVWGEGIWTSQA